MVNTTKYYEVLGREHNTAGEIKQVLIHQTIQDHFRSDHTLDAQTKFNETLLHHKHSQNYDEFKKLVSEHNTDLTKTIKSNSLPSNPEIDSLGNETNHGESSSCGELKTSFLFSKVFLIASFLYFIFSGILFGIINLFSRYHLYRNYGQFWGYVLAGILLLTCSIGEVFYLWKEKFVDKTKKPFVIKRASANICICSFVLLSGLGLGIILGCFNKEYPHALLSHFPWMFVVSGLVFMLTGISGLLMKPRSQGFVWRFVLISAISVILLGIVFFWLLTLCCQNFSWLNLIYPAGGSLICIFASWFVMNLHAEDFQLLFKNFSNDKAELKIATARWFYPALINIFASFFYAVVKVICWIFGLIKSIIRMF